MRPNLSLGDSLAGLHAAFGILLGLYHRDRLRQPSSEAAAPAGGQVIDVAIYESVFNMMESLFPEFDTQGVVRERVGSAISGIVPSNTLPLQRWRVCAHRRQRGLDLANG